MRPSARPRLTQLPEDHRLILQKEEEEVAARPVPPKAYCGTRLGKPAEEFFVSALFSFEVGGHQQYSAT